MVTKKTIRGTLLFKVVFLSIIIFIIFSYVQGSLDQVEKSLNQAGVYFQNLVGKERLIEDEDADQIHTRFSTPSGYHREPYADNSFGTFIRELKLKKMGSPVLLHDGKEKAHSYHISVLDIALLPQDLIQCADAVIKIRAEYFYKKKEFNKISFELTNGMNVPFSKFANGERIKVTGNKTRWVKGNYKKGFGRNVFDEYLKFIYIYAGTISLSKQMQAVDIKKLEIGDVFIQGGSPGHVVMVVDMAIDQDTSERIMMLAQSAIPSQEIHIIKNNSFISPWYKIADAELVTPGWVFKKRSQKRW